MPELESLMQLAPAVAARTVSPLAFAQLPLSDQHQLCAHIAHATPFVQQLFLRNCVWPSLRDDDHIVLIEQFAPELARKTMVGSDLQRLGPDARVRLQSFVGLS